MATPARHRHPLRAYVSAVCILVLAVGLPGFVRAQAPPPGISITDLGGDFTDAHNLNNRGQITGVRYDADGNYHIILWENGTLTQINSSDERGWIGVSDINDLGHVVGSYFTYQGGGEFSYGAWLWPADALTDFGGLHAASGINNVGQVVGSIETNCEGPYWDRECDYHAAVWQNATVLDLGTLGGDWSWAAAINNQGQIVGTSTTASGAYHAYLWHNGAMVDLGTLGGDESFASDINSQGQIVGTSTTASGEEHAFLWHNGIMTDLGTLGGMWSRAAAINDYGQIVGTSALAQDIDHAFLWHNGAMVDLGTLGGDGSMASDINEQRQVLGASSTTTGEMHVVLWILPSASTTPQQLIVALQGQVEHLLTSKVLNKGQTNSLTTKLDGALSKLDRGDTKAAANQLHAFVNQVTAFRNAKKLTTTQAQPLIDAAKKIISQLRR